MAKAARKLKVFQTRIGFYDLVIATGSRAAALRAWGTGQDLFAQGMAAEATEADAIAAALAHPDTVLKRPVGSTAAFSTDPARPRIVDIDPGDDDAPAPAPAPPRKAAPRPPPDRSKLNAAEAALAELDRSYEAESAEYANALTEIAAEEIRLRERRIAAEAEAAALERQWRKQRGKAEDIVERERRAYERSFFRSE